MFTERTNAVRAAERVGVDAVVEPGETRDRLVTALERSRDRTGDDWPPKKHSTNPV